MRFFRPGLLAIEQKAFFFDFPEPPKPTVENRDGVAIVTIRGPVVHHEEGCFDAYDAIKSRVRAAVDSKPKAILLSIDSPGGMVSGCFDTSAEIRAICEEANVPLYAYVDGQTASAGVALACAADTIFIPAAGIMGSIGVLEGIVDETQMDARAGLAFVFVASGARKLDGNPHAGISDEAIAETQARVNTTAERFFELVAESRGLETDQIRALQARVLVGQQAIDAGLADQIATEDEAIAMIAEWANQPAEPSASGENSMKTMAEIRAALKAVAEGDGDEKEKDDANKMLSATEEHEEPDGDEPAPEPAAVAEEPDGDEEEEDEPEPTATSAVPAAASSSNSESLALAARVQKLEAEAAQSRERDERHRLMASRPDFTKEVRAFLAKQPIGTVRDAVKTLPRGPAIIQHPAAAAQGAARPTLGDANSVTAAANDLRNLIVHPESDEEIMDRKMGIGRRDPAKAIRSEGTWRRFGALTAEEATELTSRRNSA